MAVFGPLVSTDWLALNKGASNVKIIDGSWRMPGAGNAVDSFNSQHISGAVFFNIDEVADTASGLPHMLPSPEQFEEAVGALSVAPTDLVVVYDDVGVFSAARVWWTFRAMGHEKVAVLDGGLPKWLSEGRAVTSGVKPPAPVAYKARPIDGAVASAADVREALAAGLTVADARPLERFHGTAPEPRPGLRSGHMPGAISLPHSELFNADGTMVSPSTIREHLAACGVKSGNRIITSCGSGVTAAVLSLAIEVAGISDHALYDGSWSEWGKEGNDNHLFSVVTDASE
ncbi:sulfurtransferase [Hyphococcus sp.]|uniref:sulfurtransferase n=1 Tax=Hyphococcus sp. TaxID=2038636 RepID=UPI00207FE135|nr:MAG: sulfurtransferase [Marinicaulis sp.]